MITSLKMINWRIYEEREFEFKKGITFLMGSNGSGKTSILEAIAYALTGEAALFQKGERSNLLRNANKPGIVTLVLEIDSFDYEIMRTQNPDKAGDAYIKRLKDKKNLAQTHTGVTKQVEKLLGISDDFLRRIIYMAEGDVFNFINKPPKDALDIQIRSVLGLTQLDEFDTALSSSEKTLKNRMKNLQDLNADLIRLDVRSMSELENKLKGQTLAREQFLARLEGLGHELAIFERNTSIALNFKETISELLGFTQASPELWEGLENSTVLEYLDNLQNRAREAENHHSEIRLTLAKLDGQEEAYKRIIALLEPFENSDDTVPCPVCRKPMTKSERKTILEEIKEDVEKISSERKTQNQAREKSTQGIRQLNNQVGQLTPFRNLLVHSELPGIHPSQSFSVLAKYLADFGKDQQTEKQTELARQRETVRERIKELDSFVAEYQTVKNRLGDFGFDSPEDLGNELVQIEVRMLSLRAASQAIEETLQSQQNTDMKVIYEQIADLWSSFRGDEENWEMVYNVEGYPVMTKGGEKTGLDLRQLSGGEKTALLIQLHTIMAHHFSKSDFLMIDEPLEHLDPVNRRSLIKFLIDAYNHQIFGQAIIATFEESLIRKYQSNEGVHIILV